MNFGLSQEDGHIWNTGKGEYREQLENGCKASVHACVCVCLYANKFTYLPCVHVLDKATDTINELRRVLDREPVMVSVTAECCKETADVVEHSDHSYGAAGHRLRSLLGDVTRSPPAKTVLFAEPQHVMFLLSVVQ